MQKSRRNKIAFKQQNGITQATLRQGRKTVSFLLDSDQSREILKEWLRSIAKGRYLDRADKVSCELVSITSQDYLKFTYKMTNDDKIDVEAPNSSLETFLISVGINVLEDFLSSIGRSDYGYKAVLKNAFPKLYIEKGTSYEQTNPN